MKRRFAVDCAVAAGLVLLTAAFQSALWQWIAPTLWLLSTPAVLIGAKRGGITGYVTTALSVAMVNTLFAPHTQQFPFLSSRELGSSLLLLAAGSILSFQQNRSRAARNELSFHSAILRNLGEGVFLVRTSDASILYTNPRFDALFGYEPGELVGKNVSVLNFAGEHTAEDRARQINEQLHTKGVWTGEVHNCRKDGTPFFSHVRVVTFEHSAYGKVWIGVHEDITARKEAEASAQMESSRVREAERRFEQLARAMDEVFWMTDTTKTRIVYVSPSYERVWGRSCADLYAHPYSWLESVHPDDRARVRNAAQDQIGGGEYEAEYRIVRPDGDIRWIRDKGALTRNDNGESIGFAGIASDITAQKRLTEQVIHSQKIQSLGTLASGIAHDFNNILGIILGQTTRLAESAAEEDTKRRLQAVIDTARRGAALVSQLLTFARKNESIHELSSINSIVQDVGNILLETFPRSIRTTYNLEPALPLMMLDAAQIHTLLMNLAINARDAMPRGGTLSISTHVVGGSVVRNQFPAAKGSTYVQLEVADTGTGMPEEIRKRVFEPFFTTKDVGKGTGLGLPVAFGIVESHNGFIGVESEPGLGTRISVFLPVAERDQAVPAPGPAVERKDQGAETILVVEDEPLLGEILQEALSGRGYSVVLAADGMEGLRKFAENRGRIDLVISDLGLPLLDGPALVKQIRGMAPDVPIVLVSGFIDPQTRAELESFGCTTFVQKPYRINEMLAAVGSALSS